VARRSKSRSYHRGIVVTLVGFWWQLESRRRADLRAAQLVRLDKQLSDLYGPLYARYVSGDRQWRQFMRVYRPIKQYPDTLDFFYDKEPPSAEDLWLFRRCTNTVFLATNSAIEETIVNNAELLVGERMPECFLAFSRTTGGAGDL